MIRSAITKLALIYLAIIMVLSIGFSFVLYTIASREIKNGLRRPQQSIIFDQQGYDRLRRERLSQAKANVATDLILLNVGVLVLASALSYYLAKRTLEPIEDAFDRQIMFTSNASHELRTPLTAMKTELEVALREKSISKKEMKNLLDSMLEEVDKLENLSNRLLDLSRPRPAVKELELVDLKNSITKAIERLKLSTEQKNQNVEVKANNSVKILATNNQLVDVLSILLDNASKYSPPGSQIKVVASANKRYAFVQVHDQGPGITTKDLPHIFERFYRADSARSKTGASGYGLGLAIARESIEDFGGKIKAGNSNHGAVFTIQLPLAR